MDVAKAAAVCVGIMAQTIRDDIVDIAIPLIERTFPSQEWRQRDAAIELFGQILDGPSDERFETFVEKVTKIFSFCPYAGSLYLLLLIRLFYQSPN